MYTSMIVIVNKTTLVQVGGDERVNSNKYLECKVIIP